MATRPQPDLTRVYTIGFGNDVPFHYQDDAGQPTGLAVQIVDEAARRAGVRLKWVPSRNLGDSDLWVLMTLRSPLPKDLHFTEPYLQTETCYVVRDSSPFRKEADLAAARVSYMNYRIHRENLRRVLPECRHLAVDSSREAVQQVLEGGADAAFLDRYALVPVLLQGLSGRGIRVLPTSVPPSRMAIASKLKNAEVAEVIRDGMRSMTEDGALTRIVQRWGFFPNLTTDLIRELVTAERRRHWWEAGLGGVALLVGSTLYLVVRSRNQAVDLGRTSSALRTERQLNEAILNSVPGVLYLYDHQDRLRQWNPQYEEITGYAASEIGSDHGLEAIGGTEANLSRLRRTFAEARDLGRAVVEAELHTRDGRAIPFLFTAVSVEIGGTRFVTGIGLDITDRRRVEAERARIEAQFFQAQKMDSVGQLAGGIAHDFNNILAVVLMHLDLLASRKDLDGEVAHSVSEMSQASQRAAHLTRQLLMFSRKSAVEVVQVDMNRVIQELLRMVAGLLGDRIEVHHESRVAPAIVDGDARMLEQVLLNLVLNARDAMPEGGRLHLVVDSMVLEAERIEGDHRIAPGGFVRVAVRDTGCGMDETTMRRVFEPFFTTKEPGKGTGLGLASAYGILVQHNGWIEVSSRVGEGSEFRVHLPVARSRAMPAQSPGQPAVSGGRELILFVEIDDHLRWVVTKSLERLGYRVITAVDPLGAMQEWEACDGAVDLLLASMVMPGGLTGLDLAEKLRAVRPELRVILSIGHASEIHSLSYRRPETIEYLSKPYSIDALSKAVRRCLDRV